MPVCCVSLAFLFPSPFCSLPPALPPASLTYRRQRALEHKVGPAPFVVEPLRHHARRRGLDLAAAGAAARTGRDEGQGGAPKRSHEEA